MNQYRLQPKVFAYCLCVLALTSCVSYYVSEDGRYLPKRPDYSLRGKMSFVRLSEGLSTNHIYVLTGMYEEKPSYHFYRFWADGHVCHRSSALERRPTVEDANSPRRCDVGYYTFDGTNVVTEIFVPANWGSYGIRAGTAIDGDLVFTESWLRDSSKSATGRRSHRVYVKTDVGPLTSSPDW